MRNKTRYIATLHNDSGAIIPESYDDTNLRKLEDTIRSRFGAGWIVDIKKIQQDSGIMDFAPEHIKTFRLRK